MIPKLKELRNDPFLQEDWKVCPRCQGGRGEVIEVRDEEGNKRIKCIVCRMCGGANVVPKS